MTHAIRYMTALVILAGAFAFSQADTGGASPDANLEALALRLLGPWGEPGRMSVELEPGGLPDDLPFDVPLPEGAQLLGSVVRRGVAQELLNVQTVLDAQMPTQEVMASFQASLTEAGWSGRAEPQPTGFLPVQANLSAMYCSPGDEAFMYVSALFVAGRPTDVRLDINLEANYSPCPDIAMAPPDPHFSEAPMPTLTAPADSEVVVHGGMMMSDQASSSAVITSGQSQGTLMAHYEAQLEEAGWQRSDGSQDAAADSSHWTLGDEQDGVWAGVLTITEVAENQHFTSIVLLSGPQ